MAEQTINDFSVPAVIEAKDYLAMRRTINQLNEMYGEALKHRATLYLALQAVAGFPCECANYDEGALCCACTAQSALIEIDEDLSGRKD